MRVEDIYNLDILIGLGLIGLVGGILGGKAVRGRLFQTLSAWVILMAVWPVVLAVMLAVAACLLGVYGMLAQAPADAWESGHGVLAKGLSFGLILAIYGKLVWEEMRSPNHSRGAYVIGAPRSPFRKERCR